MALVNTPPDTDPFTFTYFVRSPRATTPLECVVTLCRNRNAGVEILTIGQYLQPTEKHSAIDRWVTPEEFEHWKKVGLEMGFGFVESGPLVRSSYHADEQSAHYTKKEVAASAQGI